jgi:hypothetical protein
MGTERSPSVRVPWFILSYSLKYIFMYLSILPTTKTYKRSRALCSTLKGHLHVRFQKQISTLQENAQSNAKSDSRANEPLRVIYTSVYALY